MQPLAALSGFGRRQSRPMTHELEGMVMEVADPPSAYWPEECWVDGMGWERAPGQDPKVTLVTSFLHSPFLVPQCVAAHRRGREPPPGGVVARRRRQQDPFSYHDLISSISGFATQKSHSAAAGTRWHESVRQHFETI
jgi:hypothetical protein